MLIRIALPSDAGGIGILYNQLVGGDSVNVTRAGIAELTTHRATLLVCEIDQVVAGTVLVQLCADVMYAQQPFALVENLVVHPDFRRLGVGSAMLAAVERICLEADCSKIMLMSSAHRVEAHRVFLKAGYSGDAKRGFVRYRRQMARLS
ncbi:GNAT family N-acetyltransferase [Pseudomonas syringae]|uniref:GNAT family N-acetyltransferase n=1 Tax=Pseudomonas syringae TaxID=317 RepID=UPI00031DC98A|nr:GNAT family N-acetyltransferase [Pseudomonas syringae]RMP57341.1 GCN5-related N-acetyltransferase [Pseudomonas syringae pv. atrofaciens]